MSRARHKAKVVARGRIKVDARRAARKLRDHMLIDKHLYLLELVRSGVAFGAQALEVDFDADDVRLLWRAPTTKLGAQKLTRLLDHLLTSGADAGGHRERLLALGINAALGLSPSFVEVVVSGRGERGCECVRWTPKVIDDEGAAPERERCEPPPRWTPGDVLITVRRKVGWEVLRRAAGGARPKEITALRLACRDLSVPITLRGESMVRQRSAPLVKVPLMVRGAERAWLAMVTPKRVETGVPRQGPTLELLERGVRLVAYELDTEPAFFGGSLSGWRLPLRVTIDAPALPTNASRSAVQQDAPIMVRARDAALEALPSAIDALIDVVVALGEGTADQVDTGLVDVDLSRPELLQLSAEVMFVLAAAWQRSGAKLPKHASRLLRQKWLRDPCGEPISFDDLTERVMGDAHTPLRDTVFVYEGKQALAEEQSPWLQRVVWAQERPTYGSLAGISAPADAVVAAAKEAVAHHAAFFAHAPVPIAVAPSDRHVVVEAFQVTATEQTPAPECAGLSGQVAILQAPVGTHSEVRVYYRERPLCTERVPAGKSPLAFEAAISWDDRLQPNASYDGVVTKVELERATAYLAHVAVLAAAKAVERLSEASAAAQKGLRRIGREAICTAEFADERLGLASPSTLPPALLTAKLWGSSESGAHFSLEELAKHHAAHGGVFVCVASSGRAVDGRPVVRCSERHRHVLRSHFGAENVVDYSRALERAAPQERRQAMNDALNEELTQQSCPRGPRVTFEQGPLWALLAVAKRSRRVELHSGVAIQSHDANHLYGPLVSVVDDASIVPSGSWKKVRSRTTVVPWRELEARLLARAVTLAVEQEGQPSAPFVTAYLIDSAARITAQIEAMTEAGEDCTEQRELASQLMHLRLIPVLNATAQPVLSSLDRVQQLHDDGGALPVLAHPPQFDTLDWQPIVVSTEVQLALARWWPSGTQDGANELVQRRRLAARQHHLNTLMHTPELPLDSLGKLVSDHERLFHQERDNGSVVMALARDAAARGGIEVLYRRRAVCRAQLEGFDLPVVARVNLTDISCFNDPRSAVRLQRHPVLELSFRGEATVRELMERAVVGLAGAHLGAAVADKRCPFLDPVLLELLADMMGGHGAKLRSKLLSARMLWPTVQGPYKPYRELSKKGSKLRMAHTAFPDWIAGRRLSQLDKPILLLPKNQSGEWLRSVVGALDLRLEDMTVAVAALQQRRRGHTDVPPRLSGQPAAPELRVDLTELGLTLGEGDLELVTSQPSRFTLHGPAQTRSFEQLGHTPPWVAVLRRDVSTSDPGITQLWKRLSTLALRHLRQLGDQLDALPDYVRQHYRSVVLEQLKAAEGASTVSARDRKAAVFVDTLGRSYSLQDLSENEQDGEGPLWFTTMKPPYPPRKDDRTILRLTSDESAVLRKELSLRNMTTIMQRELAAQQREAAPPREHCRLVPADRSACAMAAALSDPVIEGQVGVFADGTRTSQIDVLHGRRPLCRLEPELPWPLVAVINDDTVKPNRFFDGIVGAKHRERIIERVQACATDALKQWAVVPEGALASRWIDARLERGTRLVGHVWLPAAWPVEPSIELVKDGKVQRISVERLSGEPGFRRLIPVSGKILCATVETDADPMGAIREAVWELFKEMLTDLAGEKGNEIDKYRWSARLLGWMKLPPRVRTSTGDRVTGTKVLSIWRDEGVLWLSDGRGDIDGLFPDGAPEIFLSEQGNEGLLAVLRARAKSNPIRELGSVSVPDSSSGQREAPGAPEAVAAPEDAAVPEAAPDPEPEGELVDTWLDTLVHHVVSWGRPAPKGAPPSSDLAEALLTQLDTLGLAGSPASAVAYSRRGKAVRYQSEHKRVVLNREHAAVRALGRKVDDRIAVALMAAAAISELNRSLEGVNDAEEKRALLQLLKSL